MSEEREKRKVMSDVVIGLWHVRFHRYFHITWILWLD
jgi:hypothetical protein